MSSCKYFVVEELLVFFQLFSNDFIPHFLKCFSLQIFAAQEPGVKWVYAMCKQNVSVDCVQWMARRKRAPTFVEIMWFSEIEMDECELCPGVQVCSSIWRYVCITWFMRSSSDSNLIYMWWLKRIHVHNSCSTGMRCDVMRGIKTCSHMHLLYLNNVFSRRT